MLALPPIRNVAQRGDALALLRSLPDAYSPLVFFDPQYRALLDRQKYGDEGKSRQRRRADLPAMSEHYIDDVCRECARVLRPSGYLLRWVDDFSLCEGLHLHVAYTEAEHAPSITKPFKAVSVIAWDSLRQGMGHRVRNRGDYLLALQRPPLLAKSTWRDHGIPSRWPEKVRSRAHPHVKPIRLIKRLIAAITEPGDLVVDPAAGSFVVMHAARGLGRDFVGCDLVHEPEIDLFKQEEIQ